MSALYDFINSGKVRRACEIGATFERELVYKADGENATDLTDYSAKMQVRSDFDSDEVVLELSTEDETIEFEEAEGLIRLILTDEETAELTAGMYLYDLLLEDPDGKKIRLLEGKFEISDRVTR